MNLACLCRKVRISVDLRPEYLHECNCTLCGKLGARWANLDPAAVRIEGETATWQRADKPEPTANIHFCHTCGTTTHFTMTESAVARFGMNMTGVNTRLADAADLSGIELRFPNGKEWTGAGPFTYYKEPRTLP